MLKSALNFGRSQIWLDITKMAGPARAGDKIRYVPRFNAIILLPTTVSDVSLRCHSFGHLWQKAFRCYATPAIVAIVLEIASTSVTMQ